MKQFFRPLKQEHLSPDERERMMRNIRVFMQEHPLANTPANPPHHIPWFQHLSLTRYPMFATIVLAMLIALGGGTAAAAENAVPGDALYPFKIHVNESVRSAVALGAEEEADWQNTRAVRRLEEAANLAAQGRLNSEIREELHARFAAHEERAEQLIADLKKKGNAEAAADVSATIQARLEAYSDILANIKQSRPQAAEQLNGLRNDVNAEATSVSEVRAASQDDEKERTSEAAEGKKKAAENKLREVEKFIDTSKLKVEAATVAQARAQLTKAQETFAAGKASLSAGDFTEAFLKFKQAHTEAERAKVTLQAMIRLQIPLMDTTPEAKDNEKKNSGKSVSSTTHVTSSLKAEVLGIKLKAKTDLKANADIE